jgi:hypothetical protein
MQTGVGQLSQADVPHQPLAGILNKIKHMLKALGATIVRVRHLSTVTGQTKLSDSPYLVLKFRRALLPHK